MHGSILTFIQNIFLYWIHKHKETINAEKHKNAEHNKYSRITNAEPLRGAENIRVKMCKSANERKKLG